MNRLVLFGIGIFLTSSNYAWCQWDCNDSKWVAPPKLERGVFESTLTSECILTGSKTQLSQIAEFILKDIETSGKLKIHKGPTPVSFQGLPAFEYDVTDDLKQEGSEVVIRQHVVFATDQKTKFLYSVQSTDVQGKGMASYLKKIGFLTEVQPTAVPGKFRFQMTNTVAVERPWFAWPFIFEPIVKQTAIDKYTRYREKLLAFVGKAMN